MFTLETAFWGSLDNEPLQIPKRENITIKVLKNKKDL